MCVRPLPPLMRLSALPPPPVQLPAVETALEGLSMVMNSNRTVSISLSGVVFEGLLMGMSNNRTVGVAQEGCSMIRTAAAAIADSHLFSPL